MGKFDIQLDKNLDSAEQSYGETKHQALLLGTEILCITRTVEHNYISLSTVGIQLHVSSL